MKVKVASIVLVVMMCFVATACNDVVKDSYKTLFLAGTAYDTSMKVVASLQKQGKITDAQRAEVNLYASKFYGSYQLAVVLLTEYNKTKDATTQAKLTSAIADFVLQWGIMADYVNRIVPGALTPSIGGAK